MQWLLFDLDLTARPAAPLCMLHVPAPAPAPALQNAARNGKGKLTADVQMYAQTAVEVAQAKGVPYVDMYNSIMGVKDWDVSHTSLLFTLSAHSTGCSSGSFQTHVGQAAAQACSSTHPTNRLQQLVHVHMISAPDAPIHACPLPCSC